MQTFNLKNNPYLPSCKVNHSSKHHVFKFKLCGESLLSTPRSVIVDGIISYGGSTGVGLNLLRKSYGEFYERSHLFTQVPVNVKKKLKDIQPQTYQNKLLALCNSKQDKAACLEHTFSFTEVKNIFNDQSQYYFYNSISLNCNKSDSSFINFSDSCACASHITKDKALYNSLMEFIERQALLGSWLSKTYQYSVNSELLREICPYSDLVELLLSNGELYIFQNGNQLPGHTVMMLYFSQSSDDMVKYSIGSSSGLSLEEAIRSSFEELYQCYTFLYSSESSSGLENKAGSNYHMAFKKCNRLDIRDTIPFMQDLRPHLINTLADLKQAKKYSYQEMLDELSKISSDIYYYHQYDASQGLHHTKIFSPDFFVHMSLNSQLNVENKYAQLLNIKRETAFMGTIPFP